MTSRTMQWHGGLTSLYHRGLLPSKVLPKLQARTIHLAAAAHRGPCTDNHKVTRLQLLGDISTTAPPLVLKLSRESDPLEVREPTLSDLIQHVSPGWPLLPLSDVALQGVDQARTFTRIELPIEKPLAHFHTDTKGRGSKQFHLTLSNVTMYLRHVLYRAYKFVEMGYPIEFHVHMDKSKIGEITRLKEGLRQHPHLWPAVILKAMPEGTRMVVPPYHIENDIGWVVGHLGKHTEHRPCPSFEHMHQELQRTITVQKDMQRKRGMSTHKALRIESMQKRVDDQVRLETELDQMGLHYRFGYRSIKKKLRLLLGEKPEDIDRDLADDRRTHAFGKPWRGYHRMKMKALDHWGRQRRKAAEAQKSSDKPPLAAFGVVSSELVDENHPKAGISPPDEVAVLTPAVEGQNANTPQKDMYSENPTTKTRHITSSAPEVLLQQQTSFTAATAEPSASTRASQPLVSRVESSSRAISNWGLGDSLGMAAQRHMTAKKQWHQRKVKEGSEKPPRVQTDSYDEVPQNSHWVPNIRVRRTLSGSMVATEPHKRADWSNATAS